MVCVCEHLLVMATSEKGDAEALTGVIIDDSARTKSWVRFMLAHHSCLAGMVVHRNCSKTSWIVTHHKFTACFNHQLHLVVIHAMSSQAAVKDFSGVCNMLYDFIRKPTVSTLYKGKILKCLRDGLATWQPSKLWWRVFMTFPHYWPRWKTHEALDWRSVSRLQGCFVPLHSAVFFSLRTVFWNCCHFSSRLTVRYKPKIWTCSVRWHLWTAPLTVWRHCAQKTSSVGSLRSSSHGHRGCASDKNLNTINKNLCGFLVEETVGQPQSDIDENTEFKRSFYSVIDAVQGELDVRFGERSSELIGALAALNAEAGIISWTHQR